MQVRQREGIAIVGIGCRFPGGVDGPESFWRLLREGLDAIGPIPRERFDAEALYSPTPTPGRLVTRFGGFLSGIDLFDAAFFGVSPREAERMDPQQRLLLEVAWDAIEDAGLVAEKLAGSRTGVYVGSLYSDYEHLQSRHPGRFDIHAYTGGARCSLPGRVSHALGLQGPNISVDTACSSSLVAVHLACQAIWAGECTLALAGGSNVILLPEFSTCFSSAGMLAPDGRCKAFDARGDGFVRSEGCALVVLKPLSVALAERDPIYAVIRGSGVNHDGRDSPYMMPSRSGQEELLREVYRTSGVDPAEVQYVEAHGTGTKVGDPIEVQALASVLGQGRPAGNPLRLGSVKTNIGHTEGAAGIAGLIKAALAIKNRELPRNLHFETPNPNIPWEQLPVQVQAQRSSWPGAKAPLLAGVNSFGISGINAHVILEEAPAVPVAPQIAERPELITLSAHTPEALSALARGYLELAEPPAKEASLLGDIAHTARVRRGHHDHRLAVVAATYGELKDQLRAFLAGEERVGLASGAAVAERRGKVAFVFPGQGSQWLGMGRRLAQHEPAFRAMLEQCDAAFRPYLTWSLFDVLESDDPAWLSQLDVIQPMLFAVELGLAALWRAWGVSPDAVVGHSMGEAAAAYVAGALSLDDAARIICRRSQLMKRLSGKGAMAVVELSLEQAKEAIAGREDKVSVGVNNGPTSCVLSGDPEAIQTILGELETRGIFCRLVKVDVASHSPQVDVLEAEVRAALEGIQPRAAAIPHHSTVIPFFGRRTEDGAKMGPDYWWKNLRQPVLFAGTIDYLLTQGFTYFVEMSPHPTLVGPMQKCSEARGGGAVVLGSLRRDEDERRTFFDSLGTLYCRGFNVDWTASAVATHRVARLPKFPFQRERYWYDDSEEPAASWAPRAARRGLLGTRLTSAVDPGTSYWEMELAPDSATFLAHHAVQGTVTLPGAAYVDMALSAAREALGQGPWAVEDLALKRALFLGRDERQTVQLVLTSSGSERPTFEFFVKEGSKDSAEGQRWISLARGQLASIGAQAPRAPALEPLRKRMPESVSADALYASLRRRGLEYGALFRGIEELQRGPGEALARVRLPEALGPQASHHAIHPALLDSVFQVLAAALPEGRGEGGPLLPVSMEWLRLVRPGAKLWVHAQFRPAADEGRGTMVGDLLGFDEAGEVVLEVRGLALQRLEGAQVRPGPGDWLYRATWQAHGRGPKRAESEQGTVLILSDSGDLGRNLASNLSSRGIPFALAIAAKRAGDRFERLTRDHFRVRPDSAEDLQKLISELGGEGRTLRSVVHLWGLDSPSVEGLTVGSLQAAQRTGVHSVLHVVQALATIPSNPAPRLWVVTRGGQRVDEAGGAVFVAQTPLWGFGRSVAQEHPGLWGGLVDLDPRVRAAEQAAALTDELLGSDGETEVAFRNGLRFVARLARHRPVRSARALQFRANGTYLVTGGLGGLGLEVARWMVRHGARRLILVGRTPLPPRAVWDQLFGGTREARQVRVLRELEAMGASIHPWAIDIGDEEQLADHLETFRREGWPPICGVVHAAGLLQDRTIAQLDAEAFEAVFRPKVNGAWLLHTLLRETPLDFFVLFSSAASMLGTAGQANYCAANAFLDGLAHYRASQDLPALSINWGPWNEVGLAAREDRGGRLATRGLESFSPSEGIEAFERALSQDAVQVGAIVADWKRWVEENPTAKTPLLADLLDDAPRAAPALAAEEPKPEAPESPAEKRERIEGQLRERISKALRIPPARLDLRKPLVRMGLDSLMAVELKNRIDHDWGVVIPVVRILAGMSPHELIEEVVTAALGEDEAPVAEAAAIAAPPVAASTLPEVEPEPEPAVEEQPVEHEVEVRAAEPTQDARRNLVISVSQPASTAEVPEVRKRFLRDLELPPEIQGQGLARPSDAPAAALVTGATGFVGASLVAELLRRSPARVHCLVRAESAADAMVRLRHKMSSLGLWDGTFAQRIVPVVGDLAEPNLGLDEAAFRKLSEEVEAIFHAGAQVNFVFPYEQLRAVNVEGTKTILRLASIGVPKSVHFISSTSVVCAPGLALQTIAEGETCAEPETLPNGYAQSKWVAEGLAARARERGLVVSIYRPSFVGWNSQSGAFNATDFPTRLISACLALGAAPEVNLLLDLAPADFVAAAVVELSRRRARWNQTYHLGNPRPVAWAEVVRDLAALGVELELLPFAGWYERLEKAEDPELRALLSMLPSPGEEGGFSIFQTLAPSNLPLLERTLAIAGLSPANIWCPSIDVKLLAPLVRALGR